MKDLDKEVNEKIKKIKEMNEQQRLTQIKRYEKEQAELK